jgi:hypothetical protein
MGIAYHEAAAAKPVEDQAALRQFQQQWATYQKLVDHDGLSHRAVSAHLHEALRAGFESPFALLDIACGDAGRMPGILAGTTIRHYEGIDLSLPALELAEKNLAGAPFAVDLEHRDFVEALASRPEPVDMAWCGLSIHHLTTDDKRKLFVSLRKAASSFVMIYEPVLAPGEDRPGYLERFRSVYRPAWSFFSDEEWDQLYAHVCECDLPETNETWLALGREAGFSRAEALFTDPFGCHRIYRYDV